MYFSGKVLFDLKATHGLPLEVSLGEIITVRKLAVNWVEFIQTARDNQWWDFQTVAAIESAVTEADLEHVDRQGILVRVKQWILDNPHPKM